MSTLQVMTADRVWESYDDVSWEILPNGALKIVPNDQGPNEETICLNPLLWRQIKVFKNKPPEPPTEEDIRGRTPIRVKERPPEPEPDPDDGYKPSPAQTAFGNAFDAARGKYSWEEGEADRRVVERLLADLLHRVNRLSSDLQKIDRRLTGHTGLGPQKNPHG